MYYEPNKSLKLIDNFVRGKLTQQLSKEIPLQTVLEQTFDSSAPQIKVSAASTVKRSDTFSHSQAITLTHSLTTW